ncbi:FMN reductase [Gordonibacter sp. 28C]|uniref:flavodoxin family protein n=1 Tax=Gordonibacter sp. 28C TaxID=2078569 RepID=UPI000DF83CD1|nr:flavodoxin family protein [Gordonibacter sp. 28C]RDB59290.1 FMN reductase [Gordonibacter sp. 28C]
MGKNVLVLNGSPRREGNTAALVDAFAEGAEQAGGTIARFDVALMDIAPCRGCLGGGADVHSPCVQKDDMDAVYAAYRAADVVVLASPMYCWSFTAQMKAVLDRLFALMEAGMRAAAAGGEAAAAAAKEAGGKGCVLFMPAEEDTERNFSPIVSYYETLCERMGWRDLGRVLVGGVYRVGDIAENPALEEARALGASL